MKNIFSIVLILSLGFGCSSSRSAAGGLALTTGITMGAATVGTGIARGMIDRPSSEVPFIVGTAGGALLSATFIALGSYLFSNEGRSERELFARQLEQQLDQVEAEVEESHRIRQRIADRSHVSEANCRQGPALDYPSCMENVHRARMLDTDEDGVRDTFDNCIRTPRGPQMRDTAENFQNWLNGCPVGRYSD